MTEIATNLLLGNIGDALKFDGQLLCVLESFPPRPSVWIPVLQLDANGTPSVLRDQLEAIARTIDWLRERGQTLIYCGAGIERSPLAIAWWLHTRRAMLMDAAYKVIKSLRPEVQDRSYWIERP